MTLLKNRPVALVTIDGFGWWRNSENAIAEARTPFLDQYLEKYPRALLEAADDVAVGYQLLNGTKVSLIKTLRNAGVRIRQVSETATRPEFDLLNEEQIIIPSADIPSMDRRPEMSAFRITDKVCRELDAGETDFYLINFSNAAVVAQTGNYRATIEAIESVDTCLGWVIGTLERVRGAAIITAMHGLAERMTETSPGISETSAGVGVVPFLLCERGFNGKLRESGILRDVAPTVLELFGIVKPSDFIGQSLLTGR
jgi:bisphosphoglycerate-independent phosphoglycerate mutase (AlkP superfamily)